MKVQWKKILVKTALWLASELILNMVGLDNLADYSEFIYEQEVLAGVHLNRPAIVMPSV